jgi:hypothetical protein
VHASLYGPENFTYLRNAQYEAILFHLAGLRKS